MKFHTRVTKAVFVAAFVLLSSSMVFAQNVWLPPDGDGAMSRINSSPRHGEWVTIDAGMGDEVNAWVVYPERSDDAPVVIVIHEIYGLTDWIRSVADQLAAEGFIAVAPDMLSGKAPGGQGSGAVSPDEARRLISNLSWQEIERRLNATAGYATALPAATPRYGVVGFCWGGGISFRYATVQPDLGAAVVYYGVSPDTNEIKNIKAPVLGLYGGDDNRVNATIPDAEREMKRLGKRYEVIIYAGAGHAFLRNQSGKDGANMDAARKAWPRTVEFLREYLEQ
jgi:carboxymethylenebutenolidase